MWNRLNLLRGRFLSSMDLPDSFELQLSIFRSKCKIREQLWPEIMRLRQKWGQSIAQITPHSVERKQWVITSFFFLKLLLLHSFLVQPQKILRDHTALLWHCRACSKHACLGRADCLASGIQASWEPLIQTTSHLSSSAIQPQSVKSIGWRLSRKSKDRQTDRF